MNMGPITFVLVLQTIIILLGVFPLYFSVKVMGGEVSLGKALLVKLIYAAAYLILSLLLGPIGGAITSILMMFVYRWMFGLGTIKTLIAWAIETVIIVAAILLLGFLGVAAINSLYQV